MTTRMRRLGVLLAAMLILSGCAAGRAFRQGDVAMRAGDPDQAVAHYRAAVQADPNNPRYKIALERAMLAASRVHFERAKEFEANDQLDAARGEYRLASEFDPSNRQAAAKVAALDQIVRERVEAARPRPAIEGLRERARAASAEPILNPASREPLNLRFNNASLRDILNFIASATGINVTYDRDVTDRPATVQLDGVTLEQALQQILTVNQLAYKVLSPRSVLIFPDTPPKHTQYDEQVVRTFYISHADVTELTQLLSSIIRLPGIPIQPVIQFNKTANTIVVRGTTSVVDIIERIISQNDKPRAEVVFDIEILEVDRARVKQYGLNLTEYALGGILSPESAPSGNTGGGTGGTGGTTTTTGGSTNPTGVRSPNAFNLNTISRGFSTSDFYLAVPAAFVRFLESDTNTKLIAKPQIRGLEGQKITMNLGDEIPIVSTSYTPIATGGVGVNPLNSFQLKPVGINLDITPRVTLEGDVVIELNVESSSRGADVNVAGTNYPSFGTRKVGTRLRLRDGESNLLAGLLREDERRSLSGFPGATRVPILKQLFSNNDNLIAQTDIVMLLTPHIVRTPGITEADLRPIYIGSQQNLGVGGPPPLIAGASEPDEAVGAVVPTPPASAPRSPAAAPGATPTGQVQPPAGTTLAVPPGSSPVPGTVVVPTPAPAPATPPVGAPQTGATPAPPSAGQNAGAAPTAPPAAAPTPTTPVDAPVSSPGVGQAVVSAAAPGAPLRVGGGPYTVPISIAGATRLSMITITVTFDPALLRVRTVQEGGFLRSGGVTAVFTQQVSPGRVDMTITRAADATGASGAGLLGAILFDAVAPGIATLSLSGSATGLGGTPMGLQFRPAQLTIQPQ
ncbi:MAG: secretin N-terminal domain-containing protein [Vicinamibacterales bacterium]